VPSFPKFNYVRSDRLMGPNGAYGKIECQHCGISDGTIVGAHSNWAVHGKGRGIKASDVYCASLCARCHWRLDQDLTMSKEERKAFWWNAWRKTIRTLRERGLWPKEIEVPKP